jgi:hypothetical protein
MKKETLKNIFNFIEEKDGNTLPLLLKLQIGAKLTEEQLNIEGDLDLSDINIPSLPKDLKVGGDLSIEATYIASLPKGLQVGGDLYIHWGNSVAFYDDEIREMIKPGFIKGDILRS